MATPQFSIVAPTGLPPVPDGNLNRTPRESRRDAIYTAPFEAGAEPSRIGVVPISDAMLQRLADNGERACRAFADRAAAEQMQLVPVSYKCGLRAMFWGTYLIAGVLLAVGLAVTVLA